MKKRPSKVYLLFALVCFSIQFLKAQIVNIEEKKAELLDTVAWFGSIGQEMGLLKNTSTIFTFRTAANIGRVHHKHLFLSLTDYRYTATGNEQLANQGFQHLRYVLKAKPKVFYEAFTQLQYNDQIKLKMRWLLGAGVKFNLVSKEKRHVNLGVSYMYEYNEETDPDVFLRINRMNTYLVLNFVFFDKLNILSTTYYQPNIIDFNDIRLSSQTSFHFNITKKLLFKFAFDLTYNSRIPPNVPNTIYSLTNGITWLIW